MGWPDACYTAAAMSHVNGNRPTPDSRPDAARPEPPRSGKQPRVLVVDDDKDMCAMAEAALGGRSYAVTSTGDPEEALRLITQPEYKVMLADIDSQVSNVETMIGAWRTGDTAALEKLLTEGTDEAPEIRERLLVERNRNWIPHIEKCLAAGERCFVVVGAAHLVGSDSVVDLLQKAGYKVEQR